MVYSNATKMVYLFSFSKYNIYVYGNGESKFLIVVRGGGSGCGGNPGAKR